MNIYSLFGLLLAIGVFYTGLRLASNDIKLFIDYPSMFIVFGGTLASTAISFQLNRMFKLVNIFFRRVILGKRYDYKKLIEDLIKLADASKKGLSLKEMAEKASDPFLGEGLQMVQDGIIPKDEVVSILEERNANIFKKYMNDASKVKTVGKFAPAFGMIGTTIGMIVLLANLGGEDAMKMIGPAMGVCLITTLYGAVIANLFVVPVAENLADSADEIQLKNQIIIAGVGYVMEKANPVLVAEKLNSFLNPDDRLEWKKVLQG